MNKFMNRISRILAFVMAMLLVVGGMSFTSYAREPIDTGKKGKLTITYRFKEDGTDSYQNFKGIEVSIYKIASVSEDGFSFELDSPYNTLTDIDLSTITDKDTAADTWSKVLRAVESEVITNHSADAITGVTDEDGKAVFENLDLGIYLVKSAVVEEDDCTYVFSSFLVSVPQLNEETDEWIYDDTYYVAEAFAKCERFLAEKAKFSLYKRWADAGGEQYRPQSITVVIKRDGEVYDTVTLSQDTGWSYSWEDKPGYTWSFEESYTGDVSYNVSISGPVFGDGGVVVYTITNSYTPSNPPGDNPPPPGDTPPGDTPPGDNPPGDTPPGTPDLPDVLGAIRDLPQVLGARRLPQTGLLWWPLPILLIAGAVFIVKGIKNIRSNRA